MSAALSPACLTGATYLKRPVREVHRFMNASEPFPNDFYPDQELAHVQLSNAEAHLRSAAWALSRGMANDALHSIAIAIELGLKSYLLNAATTDAWNRAHIGHDLDKAITYAERAGLDPPSGLRDVARVLHPHFQRGGFQREPSRQWPEALAGQACSVASTLLVSVSKSIGPRRDI
ncbi:hypothetical protein [Sphingomonas ursincola]|uniref:HEPN domain-containing protein n=2 Tax=Sphingomonas ursincola TaxID=56361 RepID=A0A7V8RGA1_9SPHN|nr:hypothetical protein [Sphingomonas ursincola]MBA1375934.1 hypothetical protein [Sphingomonas ursincola]